MSDNCQWHKSLFFRNLSHFCGFRLELGLWIKIPVKQRRLSWRRNLSCSPPILSADRPVFHGFFRPPPSLARVPISKFPALSASSAASFLRLHSDVVLDETPDFRPFPARQASPTLGPNSSSDVPEGLITCRLGTQQPSLAPQNSGVQ